MSCKFRLKTSYFFFQKRSKYLISCLTIATYSIRGEFRIFTKFSKMFLVGIHCFYPRMNTPLLPGSEIASALFTESICTPDRITCRQEEEIQIIPCYASLPHQYFYRIMSLKSNHTKSHTTA